MIFVYEGKVEECGKLWNKRKRSGIEKLKLRV